MLNGIVVFVSCRVDIVQECTVTIKLYHYRALLYYVIKHRMWGTIKVIPK